MRAVHSVRQTWGFRRASYPLEEHSVSPLISGVYTQCTPIVIRYCQARGQLLTVG